MKPTAPSDESSSVPHSRPVRTCIGCRRRAAKHDLVRIVSIVDGTTIVLAPDLRGTATGRGAYLHPCVPCLDRAIQRRAFGRALRTAGEFDLTVLTAYVGTAHQIDRAQPRNPRSDDQKWSTSS